MKLNLTTLNAVVLSWIITASSDDPQDFECKSCIDFAVGGQAVIEGVMMRSPKALTIAVRKADKSISVKRQHYQTLTQRYKWLNIPIVRGVVNLFEMMVIGTKAINWSASESIEEEIQEETNKSGKKHNEKLWKVIEAVLFVLSFVVAIGFSLLLFKAVPLGITSYLQNHIPLIKNNFFVFNLVDGALKATIFLTYIYVLTLIPSFHRIFEYHGAEHKSIYNYEKDLPLKPENANKQSRFHPRCGTSFILIVFIVSILFYSFLPKQPTYLGNLALRVTFLPFVAGISYELLKLSAKHLNNAFVKIFTAPGLAFQRLTTKEPDLTQLEVGLESLKEALAMEAEK